MFWPIIREKNGNKIRKIVCIWKVFYSQWVLRGFKLIVSTHLEETVGTSEHSQLREQTSVAAPRILDLQ